MLCDVNAINMVLGCTLISKDYFSERLKDLVEDVRSFLALLLGDILSLWLTLNCQIHKVDIHLNG